MSDSATTRDTRRALPLPEVRVGTVVAPLVVGVASLGLWQLAVTGLEIDPYIVPAPSAIWDQLVAARESIVSASPNGGVQPGSARALAP